MGDVNRFAMNQITAGPTWGFAESLTRYHALGIRGVGVARERLLEYGLEAGARLLRDQGMSVASYCFGGLFADATGLRLNERVDDFRRMLDEGAAIGAASVVFLAGGLPDGSVDLAGAQERALEGLSRVIPHARDTGMTIGLEPLHPSTCAFRSVLVTTGQAMDWIEQLDNAPELSIVFDVYATWWDPNLEASLARANGRLSAYHLSDWLRDTQDPRLDRGMLGDGCIDVRSITRWVEATGFSGFHELEILSERNWWRRDPSEAAATGLERYEALV